MSKASLGREGLYFENAVRLSTHMGDYLVQLSILTQQNGGLSNKDNYLKLAALAKQIDNILKETHRTELGGQYGILAPTFEALSLFASLASNINVAQLAIGLHTASIGIDQSTSSLGLFGPTICKVANLLHAGFINFLPQTDLGKRKIFKDMILFLIGAVMVATSLVLDERGEDNGTLDVELTLIMALSSGLIESISLGIAQFVSDETATQEFITAALSLTQILIVIASVAKKNQTMAQDLVEIFIESFEKWTVKINHFISERIKVHHYHAQIHEFATMIQQGVMAIERKDSEIFIQLINDLLSKLNISQHLLQTEIGELAVLTKELMGDWRLRKQTIGRMNTGIVSG